MEEKNSEQKFENLAEKMQKKSNVKRKTKKP